MGRVLVFALTAAAALLSVREAMAQVTPSDVRDLVGARAPGGESELAARGYVVAGARTGDDRKWTYWWNATRGVCLSVATVEGRYDSIVATPAPDCGIGGRADIEPRDRARPADDARPDHLSLVCYGEQERLENERRDGYAWDRDKRRYEPRSDYELTTKSYDTAVSVQIDGGSGRIRPAKDMVPLLHSGGGDGWYPIDRLSISPDTISGQFEMNGFNRPTLTIDRNSGRITLEGLTNFRGTCEAMAADRKF